MASGNEDTNRWRGEDVLGHEYVPAGDVGESKGDFEFTGLQVALTSLEVSAASRDESVGVRW